MGGQTRQFVSLRRYLAAASAIWGVAIVMNVIGLGVLGWRY